jgi:ribose 5-phosphate isomerase B
MRIALASDHAGYPLKEAVKGWLAELEYEWVDFGTDTPDSCDYPDFVIPAAKAVVAGECEKGVFICGTGLGMAITANKIPGVRAVLCTNSYMAGMGRRHNDANALVMGSRVIGEGLAREILEVFLATGFEGGRHTKRLEKIRRLESTPR